MYYNRPVNPFFVMPSNFKLLLVVDYNTGTWVYLSFFIIVGSRYIICTCITRCLKLPQRPSPNCCFFCSPPPLHLCNRHLEPLDYNPCLSYVFYISSYVEPDKIKWYFVVRLVHKNSHEVPFEKISWY